MDNEWIDILDRNGIPTGKKALKQDIHKHGYYHNTVHIWFYTENGDILLAQRAASKLICPNLWDVSVAGHVDAGETLITAAIREINEELGIHINEVDLVPIGVFLHENEYNNGAIKDYEFHNVYITELKCKLKDLNIDKNEVQAIKTVTFDEFEQLLDNSNTNLHFISSNRIYYEFVIQEIKNQLTSS